MEAEIAIVGASCRFAGAGSVAQFGRIVMDRRRMTTPLEAEIALAQGAENIFDAPYPVAGAQLGDLYACIAREQRFPRKINAGENQDLYFINQLAFDALNDAGMRPYPSVAVKGALYLGYAPILNASTVNWMQHTFFIDQTIELLSRFFPHAPASSIDHIRRRLSESLPAPDAESFLTATGYRVADTVARACGLDGPAATLDSGVTSFFDCVRNACYDLQCGRVDVALAGAVMPPVSRAFLQGISGNLKFSTGMSLTPFDCDASGTLPGEGGGFFVLKRRADALRSRDRIYALVRATAFSTGALRSDAITMAIEAASVRLNTIRFVEADGNGIPESDLSELSLLAKLWGAHSAGSPLVGVGSVKGNFGHTFRAAGFAGALKAALALKMRVLMPQVPAKAPQEFANASSSVYILNAARPWVTRDAANPRRALVMGSNFTGRHGVMLLEEEPEER